MFQFTGFAFQNWNTTQSGEFTHSGICASKIVDISARLIAAFYALHRLTVTKASTKRSFMLDNAQ